MQISDWVADFFKSNEIDTVFLYPGGTVAPLVNSCLSRSIAIETFKSEQGAIYAALAYARVTGRPQVAMVTSGPGVTNAISPLADAFYDSTPLILITGQISTADLKTRSSVRQRGFQEVPTIEITAPITKRSTCLMDVEHVFREIPLAFQLCQSHRFGPVVIDFPMDIQRSDVTQFPQVDKTTSTAVENTLSSEVEAILQIVTIDFFSTTSDTVGARSFDSWTISTV